MAPAASARPVHGRPIDSAHLAATVLPSHEKGGEQMTTLQSIVQRFRIDDRGQGLAEYALILALIAIIAIISLIYLGTQVSDKLSVIGNAL